MRMFLSGLEAVRYCVKMEMEMGCLYMEGAGQRRWR